LAPADRSRLVAMLGMLGSAHAGERDAAGLAATRLLRDRGLTWADIVLPGAPSAPSAGDWRQQAAEAARYPGLLTAWERTFLAKIGHFPRLSEKQQATLAAIVAKVRA
jgi:hypothetical protein